jgi:hypothetical protein
MLFLSIIFGIVFALAAGFIVIRRWIEPTCPDCRNKEWIDIPRGIVCTSCGWSNIPVKHETTQEAIAA